MVYNLTSVKRVIAKVLSDLDLKEGDHRISDMIEWAGEALEKIGGFPAFENKVLGMDGYPLLTISNYQAKLPCDFHSMIQVAYSTTSTGPFYPMTYATGSFSYGSELTISETTYTVGESEVITLCMSLYNLNYADALAKINSEPNTRALLESLLQPNNIYVTNNTTSNNTDITYVIKSGYIKTNVEDGYLLLAYQAIPTDDQGYPMIPDNQSFMEAIYWYINMKLLYPEWRAGLVRDAVYTDAKRSWNFYCKQAYGNAMMPNGAEQFESIKNTWHRLSQEFNEHDSFFSSIGQEQVIYNANA